MRVLIGCERSGIVRDAFRTAGHDAWSVDLEPCEADPYYHFQADLFDVAKPSGNRSGHGHTMGRNL